jgi:hypothetical protein
MRERVALGVSFILIGVLVACGSSPTPTQPSPNRAPPPPAPSKALTVTDLRMDGPSRLAPGASGQYTATATYSDGSSLDVTSQSKWSSTDDAILSVTVTGLATARSNGAGAVTAAFGTLSLRHDVLVLPTGLYMLRMMVTEEDMSEHLDNVRVAVVSGPAAGLATTTAWDGTATLLGVPQDAQIGFTKDGYQPVVQSVHLDGNGGSIVAQLIPSAGRLNLAGQYQLTLSGGNCSGDGVFPEAAKTRTYAASIQNAPTYGSFGLIVNLSGANFALGTCPLCGGETRGNFFGGQTEVADGRFTLVAYAGPADWNDGIYPNVVEKLADGSLLTISGQAIVTPTPNGFAGTLDGAFGIYRDFVTGGSGGSGSQAVATCRSSALPFALVRLAGSGK